MTASRQLVARWLLAAGLVATGIAAGRQSLATAIGDRRPAEALRIDHDEPAALALEAYTVLLDKPRPDDLAAAESTLRRAVRGDPTQVAAFVDMALVRTFQGRSDAATRLMRYAQQLSRRNLLAQLWWIEYWSARGNVDRTLRHYDIALRTSAGAPSILFPVLVNAAAGADIADPLARVLATRPIWGEQFVQQLAQSSVDVTGMARVLTRLADRGAPVPGRTLATAIDRLLALPDPDAAWRLYARYRPRQALAPLRNPRFTAAIDDPTAFDWRLSQEGVSTSVGDGGLRIDANPGGGGEAVRQVLRLGPGRHRLRFRFSAADAVPSAERPVLAIRCLATGTVLADSGQSRGEDVALDVTTPPSCPAQAVSVSLQSGDAAGGSSAVIHEVAVVE